MLVDGIKIYIIVLIGSVFLFFFFFFWEFLSNLLIEGLGMFMFQQQILDQTVIVHEPYYLFLILKKQRIMHQCPTSVIIAIYRQNSVMHWWILYITCSFGAWYKYNVLMSLYISGAKKQNYINLWSNLLCILLRYDTILAYHS